MNNLSKSILATAAMAVMTVGASGAAFAKGGTGGGGNGGGSNFVATTFGDCANTTTADPSSFVYPLTNSNFPGAAAVTINVGGSQTFASSVCLEDGWAVTYNTVSNGFQANFTYNGVRAIDMKYVAGKTDIRNY